MPLSIVEDDIINRDVDAVVNAANSELLAGGGVCGAIFSAAGYEQLQAACDAIGGCAVGSAVITPGFDLRARYVIHAVGPVWQDGGCGEVELLRSAYRSALDLAVENGCQSIAFPLISSGIYGVPKDIALSAARQSFEEFLTRNDLYIELVLYDRSVLAVGYESDSPIRAYLDDRYVEQHSSTSYAADFTGLDETEGPEVFDSGVDHSVPVAFPDDTGHLANAVLCDEFYCADIASPSCRPSAKEPKRRSSAGQHARKHGRERSILGATQKGRDLDSFVKDAGETFSEMLLRLIDQRGLTDPEVYRKANLDRKLFSKIRSDDGYSPSKRTALALCIALELPEDETCDLLARAGFAFSPSSVGDLIVRYFIEQGDYDIYRINEALFAYDQPLLCA